MENGREQKEQNLYLSSVSLHERVPTQVIISKKAILLPHADLPYLFLLFNGCVFTSPIN